MEAHRGDTVRVRQGAGGVLLEGRRQLALMSALQLLCLPSPAAFSLGRPPLPQPFCAAQALDGRKGLLKVLEEDQVLPSYTSVAVLVDHGLGRRWAHGGRESDLPL